MCYCLYQHFSFFICSFSLMTSDQDWVLINSSKIFSPDFGRGRKFIFLTVLDEFFYCVDWCHYRHEMVTGSGSNGGLTISAWWQEPNTTSWASWLFFAIYCLSFFCVCVFIPSPVRVGTLLMEVPGTPNGASLFEFALKPTGKDSDQLNQRSSPLFAWRKRKHRKWC